MRSTHESTVHFIRAAAIIVAYAACTPAFGQFTSAPGDSRYYTPPVAEQRAEAATVEPLLRFRREDAGTSDNESPPAERQTRIAAAPPVDGDVNPLRQPAEPPREVPPATTPDALTASALAGPTATPLPLAPLATAETNATPLPTPTGVVNPFPEITPAASSAQHAAVAPPVRYDAALQVASHNEVQTATSEPAAAPLATSTPEIDDASRRLAPPDAPAASGASNETKSNGNSLSFAFTKLESFSTAGAGLAIVVGLFLICVWLLRRGGAKTSGVLPTDAFAVLGRAPLTPQSFAHLLRLGNKLVLVAMSPDGIQPLTEVTDPMEVDRLTGLCATGRGHGPSAEFQQVLSQLSREPARGFLGGEAKEGRRR
jgi:flagellar biogenesis protein FliO